MVAVATTINITATTLSIDNWRLWGKCLKWKSFHKLIVQQTEKVSWLSDLVGGWLLVGLLACTVRLWYKYEPKQTNACVYMCVCLFRSSLSLSFYLSHIWRWYEPNAKRIQLGVWRQHWRCYSRICHRIWLGVNRSPIAQCTMFCMTKCILLL